MPMRENCKFFESRTYPSGDTVRKCDLDLAPEAPWRCPGDCPAFEPRLADVNWKYGSLVTPPTPAEPASLGDDESIGALLDAAEDIVRNAGPEVMADIEREQAEQAIRDRRSPSAKAKGLRKKLGGLGQYLRDQRKKGK